MVGVGVGNDYAVNGFKRQAALGESATYGSEASGKACVDEDGLPGIDQEGDPGADGPKLENAVSYSYGFAKHGGLLNSGRGLVASTG